MIDMDPQKMVDFAKNKVDSRLSDHKAYENFQEINKQFKIFLYKFLSVESIMDILQKLFNHYDLKEEDLSFILKD